MIASVQQHDFMPLLYELPYKVDADESSAADDENAHVISGGVVASGRTHPTYAALRLPLPKGATGDVIKGDGSRYKYVVRKCALSAFVLLNAT